MNNSTAAQEQPRKREKCPYGFECSLFMLIPGTIAHDCENLGNCKELSGTRGFAWHDPNQPNFDMVMYFADEQQDYERWAAEYARRQQQEQQWQEENRRYRRIITIRQREAATLMLKSRGNHQDYSNFEIQELADRVSETLDGFFLELEQLPANDNMYIAPDGVEAHVYSVKRPPRSEFPQNWSLREVRREQRIYHYHKLTSKKAQFTAVTKDEEGNNKTCKVIHLSHSDNARNIQGRLGIERRNKLNKIRTRLLQAKRLLDEATAIAQEEYSFDDILMQSREAANELDEAELQTDE
ncbi:MAG: hypothetical protein AAFR77_00415 [Cyanobacteria bacterium J06631_2]